MARVNDADSHTEGGQWRQVRGGVSARGSVSFQRRVIMDWQCESCTIVRVRVRVCIRA